MAYRKESYPPAAWRLIQTGFQNGPSNMALDEAILEAVAAGDSPPTLRFYGWQPTCLSLGYGQNWEAADFDACARLGWDVVRRPTGGRAILHVDELTYSVCAPVNEPRVQGGVLESYQRLSEALLRGLKLMGLEPARAKPYYEDRGEPGPACFDGPSNYEITIGQRKLVGSAQVRKQGVVLQHGTLPLFGDVTRIALALFFDLPGQRLAVQSRLHYRATTLEQSLGRWVAFDEAAHFMRQGFEQALGLTLLESLPTPQELERAAALQAEKYATDRWTKRI
ncbi:MAG: lipoate--protein ligase family protein [Chloroflexota bacterium]